MPSNKSILIIEDDEGIREALRLTLEIEGYEVILAANGREGLQQLARMPHPSVILLDLMMPIMDGWAFADAMAKEPELAGIPIVVITAFSAGADIPKQARSVLGKPIELNHLLDVVAKYVAAAAPGGPRSAAK